MKSRGKEGEGTKKIVKLKQNYHLKNSNDYCKFLKSVSHIQFVVPYVRMKREREREKEPNCVFVCIHNMWICNLCCAVLCVCYWIYNEFAMWKFSISIVHGIILCCLFTVSTDRVHTVKTAQTQMKMFRSADRDFYMHCLKSHFIVCVL